LVLTVKIQGTKIEKKWREERGELRVDEKVESDEKKWSITRELMLLLH